ncbi:MAG TPA: heme lyase CcmF/NrfE family subunit [Chloroflexota bacterium]
MISTLGHLVTLLAFGIAIAGSAMSFEAWRSGNQRLLRQARLAVFLVLGLVSAAVLLMEIALVGHDFSVRYVADVGSRETPLYYTIISLWAALEGSILFWTFLLSLYTGVFLQVYRNRFVSLQPATTGILLAISSFFLYVIIGPGDPFRSISPAPLDGPGPNPLLQNHWMMGVHPVLLYCGYVGLSVPFALAMASLMTGTPSNEVLRLIRRWALVPWIFLSLGIVAGMWWAYAVLGWGGYWSWDPVENVSVMPWLVTTAFLHSLQVQERRQMLKTWTMSLVIAAFVFSLLGTFITRSGVLESVHSFTQSGVGPAFLVFLGVILTGSLGLLLARSRELQAPGALEATVCRETAFMFNNLLLIAMTFVILLGTLFPLIAEALQGTQLSVGAPYFDHLGVPIGVALLFLMGVGPSLPWGAARMEDLQYRLLPPVVACTATVLFLLLLGVRGAGALTTFGLASFALAVTVLRITADIGARKRGTHERWPRATRRLFAANPRRYGGYTAHVGVLLAVIGIAASQTYQMRSAATLHPGQSMRLDGYTMTYVGLRPHGESNRMVLGAAFMVRRGTSSLGTLQPSVNIYANSTQPVITPAVREEPGGMLTGLLSGRNPLPDLAPLLNGRNPFEDVYLVLMNVDTGNASIHRASRSVTVQAYINPMVGFIWLGGVLLGLGGLFALVPVRRRRMVTEVAPEPVRLHAEEAAV